MRRFDRPLQKKLGSSTFKGISEQPEQPEDGADDHIVQGVALNRMEKRMGPCIQPEACPLRHADLIIFDCGPA
jgi:hypothetical protein